MSSCGCFALLLAACALAQLPVVLLGAGWHAVLTGRLRHADGAASWRRRLARTVAPVRHTAPALREKSDERASTDRK
eukprot:1185683-Prorocentrum_minimum.AAC.3